MPSERLPRKDKERIRRNQEALAANLSLFSTRGLHTVLLKKGDKASRFALGTLNTFLKSEDTLFGEMTRNGRAKIKGTLLAIIGGPGIEAQRLQTFIYYQPKLFLEYDELFKLYVLELTQRNRNMTYPLYISHFQMR